MPTATTWHDVEHGGDDNALELFIALALRCPYNLVPSAKVLKYPSALFIDPTHRGCCTTHNDASIPFRAVTSRVLCAFLALRWSLPDSPAIVMSIS